jgi:hypothetical protein
MSHSTPDATPTDSSDYVVTPPPAPQQTGKDVRNPEDAGKEEQQSQQHPSQQLLQDEDFKNMDEIERVSLFLGSIDWFFSDDFSFF